MRLAYSTSYATIGPVGNPLHKHRKLGFGRVSRYLGRRPVVRGMSMENGQHPHGGSHGHQGRTSQGNDGSDWKCKGQLLIRVKPHNNLVLTSRQRARFERYGVWYPGKKRLRGGGGG